MVHTSVYDKRNDFRFPIVNIPWLSGDVPSLPSYGLYLNTLVKFAGVILAFSISIQKKPYKTPIDTGLQISQASKMIWKYLQAIFRALVQTWWNIVSKICFWRNFSTGQVLDCMTVFVLTPQRRQGPDHNPLGLLVGTSSADWSEIASRLAEHCLLWRMSLYTYSQTCFRDHLYIKISPY